MNGLGIDKAPAATRVVVAMSGGVDSATTAALLVEQGYEVVGITLQLYDHGQAVGKSRTCCAGQDIHDARRTADALGIPHYVLDYERRFYDEVIAPFADGYIAGQTPIPCVLCNQTVKFRDLLAAARDLNADALATGHYVRRADGADGAEMHRAADETRDQSYFLFRTTREQLAFLRFPLGGLSKDETRALARRFALPVASKPDSQDICFVPDGDYARLVAKLRPGAAEPGEIVDLSGRVLGHHEGIIHYTIGQRRGIGLSSAEPLFVVRLEPTRKRVVVGPRAALGRDRVRLGEVNWLGAQDGPPAGARVRVKLRATAPAADATLYPLPGGGVDVALDAPQQGIAPGQACVFYDGERVLGGGWILREEAAQAA